MSHSHCRDYYQHYNRHYRGHRRRSASWDVLLAVGLVLVLAVIIVLGTTEILGWLDWLDRSRAAFAPTGGTVLKHPMW